MNPELIANKVFNLYNTSKEEVFNKCKRLDVLHKRYVIILLINELVVGNIDKKRNYNLEKIKSYTGLTQSEVSNAIYKAKRLKQANFAFNQMYHQCKAEILN